MKAETEIGKWLSGHKKEVVKGFTDSFDFILELDRHPEKLKRIPDKGILTRKGKKFIIKPENGHKLVVL